MQQLIAPGLKNAIFATFHKHSLESVLIKIVFLSSDGHSVNSSKDSGLIKLLQEDFPWISFIWCFHHRLELALKDVLKEFVEPIDTSLVYLLYLYKKSSKKHGKLKNFYHFLEGQFEMYSAGVRPLKAIGTRWIDHKITAMEHVIEKFGLYTQDLQHSIDTAKKSQNHATLQGKFTKLVNAKFLLRCALFTDALAEAKHFSLITQDQNIDIIRILDSVENTKHNYKRLLKKLRKNEDVELMYQNQKVQFYTREKCFIKDHIVQIVQRVVSSFEKRYGNLYSNLEETSINILS